MFDKGAYFYDLCMTSIKNKAIRFGIVEIKA